MKRQLGEIPLFAAILAAALQAAPAGGASPPIVIDNPSSSLFLSQMPGTDARLDEVASPSGMANWGRAGVTRSEEGFVAVLENSRLLIEYGRHRDKDKLRQFVCKLTGRNLGPFDSRHSPARTAFFTLKDARVIRCGPDRKTLRLDFGSRVQDVSVFPDCPVLEIDYHSVTDAGHTIDQGGDVGAVVAFGAADWLEERKRVPAQRAADTGIDREQLYPMYKLSYYRAEWGPPGPLSYRGWMILGIAHEHGGYGLLLPADKVKWLKLMNGPNPRGFERMMQSPYRAYYFRVTDDGPDRIISMGKEIIDGAFPQVAGLKPLVDGKKPR